MESGNGSSVTKFILLGLSSNPKIKILLFQVFLTMYIVTMTGNFLLIAAVKTDSRLHSSMYLFLSNLSFMDTCYSSVIIPRMLIDFLSSLKSISLRGCLVQVYFYLFLGETECLLLAFMSYDRYVAICNPLRYHVVMSIQSCARLIAVAWVAGCLLSLIDVYYVYKLTFCGSNIIDHFFCESKALIQLACSNVFELNIVILASVAFILLFPVCMIAFSYVNIILTIVKIGAKSSKPFSTCVSHLIVVILFYGSAIYTYTRPKDSVKDSANKVVSVFYTLVTPMLNPLIYSLRNKDVQQALRKLWC